MKHPFVSNLILVFVINIGIKGVYLFGVDRAVQNAVGPSAYGWYFDVFNFCLLFQIVLDFGFQNHNTRHVAQHPHMLRKYFPSIFLTKLLLAVAFMLVTWLAAWVVFGGGYPMQLLWPIICIQVLTSMLLFFRSHVSGLGLYRTDSLLSGLDRLLMIILIGIPVYMWSHFSILHFLTGQIIALTLANAVLVVVLWGRLRWRGARLSVMRWMLKSSTIFALVTFLMTLYTRVDAVMLERLLPEPEGSFQVGIYAAAYRLLDALNIVGLLSAGLLLPMFSKALVARTDVRSLAKLGFGVLWTIGVAVALNSLWWATDIMDILYHQLSGDYVSVYRLLIVTFLAWSVLYVFGTLLMAAEKMVPMCIVFAICAVLNIVLNACWIPKWQAVGSAMATVCTQGTAAILITWLVSRYIPNLLTASFLIKCAGVMIMGVIGAWMFYTFTSFYWFWQWVLSGMWVLLSAWLTGLISKKLVLKFL